MSRIALVLLGLRAAVCTRVAPHNSYAGARWHAQHLGHDSAAPELPLADRFLEGDTVIVLPSVASELECEALAAAGSAAAAAHRQSRLESGQEVPSLVRVPTIGAAERAALTKTPCAAPLDAEADALAITLLARVIHLIDAELPTVAASLFDRERGSTEAAAQPQADVLGALHRAGALEFSSREPTVNVYGAGGEFVAHKDHQALTVLLPLSSADEYVGGGTAFWPQDARGHRVEPPSVVLRPPKGTCLLFGGHSTHAGSPVEAGERCVLVASFS